MVFLWFFAWFFLIFQIIVAFTLFNTHPYLMQIPQSVKKKKLNSPKNETNIYYWNNIVFFSMNLILLHVYVPSFEFKYTWNMYTDRVFMKFSQLLNISRHYYTLQSINIYSHFQGCLSMQFKAIQISKKKYILCRKWFILWHTITCVFK